MSRWIVQHIKHSIETISGMQIPVEHSHCIRVHIAKDIEARGYRVLQHGQVVRLNRRPMHGGRG